MFERLDIGERAILVHVSFRNTIGNQDLNEFKDLVRSTGTEIAAVISLQRNSPDARYLIGTGKTEELNLLAKTQSAEVIIFKTLLSEEERQRVEGYLAWKWGTVSSLDSSHPYKTAPPIIEWSNDESAEPFPDCTSNFLIRTYQNMTSLYRRNVQQVPFSRASKGPISLRQRITAYSSSLG